MTEEEFLIELLRIQELPFDQWKISLQRLAINCTIELHEEFLELPEYLELRNWVRDKMSADPKLLQNRIYYHDMGEECEIFIRKPE